MLQNLKVLQKIDWGLIGNIEKNQGFERELRNKIGLPLFQHLKYASLNSSRFNRTGSSITNFLYVARDPYVSHFIKWAAQFG